MTERYIQKMYRELLNIRTNFGSLENFYNISDKRLKIIFFRTSTYSIQFNISFERCPTSVILSKKINNYVLKEVEQYAKEKINISVIVTYPEYYPFSPPTWCLFNYSDNILEEDISTYYKFIIDTHNDIYFSQKQWSPAIQLRTDFLNILMKIIMGIKYTIR